jgi:hypothetical protein
MALPEAKYPAEVFDGNEQQNPPNLPPDPGNPEQADADDYNKATTEIVAMEADLKAAIDAQGQTTMAEVIDDLQTQISGFSGGFVQLGATSLAMYSDNLPAGVTEADLGANAIDLQVGRLSAKSTGEIRLFDNPSDADTVTISDGETAVTFEFDDGGGVGGGNIQVLIGVDRSATGIALAAAINAQAFNVSDIGPSGGNEYIRLLENDNPGAHGNVPMAGSFVGFTILVGMRNGAGNILPAFQVGPGTVVLGTEIISTGSPTLGYNVLIGVPEIQPHVDTSIAIGYDAFVGGSSFASADWGGIAIGYNCQVYADEALAMGSQSTADGVLSQSIGQASASGVESVAIGTFAATNDDFGTAVGSEAYTQDAESVAVGHVAWALGIGSIAIGGRVSGFGSQTDGDGAIAIGRESAALGNDAIAIGDGALADVATAIAIGQASANFSGDVAIGNSVSTNGAGLAIVIGDSSTAATIAVALGQSVHARADGSICIGSQANVATVDDDAIAIGNRAETGYPGFPNYDSIAIGTYATTEDEEAVAIGGAPTAGSQTYVGYAGGVAVGSGAVVDDTYGTAVGWGAYAGLANATALGTYAEAEGENSVAVGHGAWPLEDGSIAIGWYCATWGGSEDSVAIGRDGGCSNAIDGVSVGHGARANANYAVGIGSDAEAGGVDSIAIGNGAQTGWPLFLNTDSIAIGAGAYTADLDATSVGAGASCDYDGGVAIGHNAYSGESDAIAIGNNADATEVDGIGIGRNSQGDGLESVAIGTSAFVNQSYGIAIGSSAAVFGDVDGIAIGRGAESNGSTNVAIGTLSDASYDNSVALGAGATATAANQIRLGTASETVSVPGDLEVDGKLTVAGLIDPTGLELTPQTVEPGVTPTNLIWLDGRGIKLVYTGASGSFDDTTPETVVGLTSGATGLINAGSDTGSEMFIDMLGQLLPGETVQGQISGVTATVFGPPTPNLTMAQQMYMSNDNGVVFGSPGITLESVGIYVPNESNGGGDSTPPYTFTGATDTGMWYDDVNGHLELGLGGSSMFRLTSGGIDATQANLLASTITDDVGTTAVVLTSSDHALYDINGSKVVSFKDGSGGISEGLQLIRNGIATVDWDSGEIFDSGGNKSIDWDSTRTLHDGSGNSTLDWGQYQLLDSGFQQSVNWDSKYLLSSGSNSVEWASSDGFYVTSNAGGLAMDQISAPGSTSSAGGGIIYFDSSDGGLYVQFAGGSAVLLQSYS